MTIREIVEKLESETQLWFNIILLQVRSAA